MNKKQLIILWIMGVLIVLIFLLTPTLGLYARGMSPRYVINWASIIPKVVAVLIIGGLLFLTFNKNDTKFTEAINKLFLGVKCFWFAFTHNKEGRDNDLMRIHKEAKSWKTLNALPDEIKNNILDELMKANQAKDNNDLELYETHTKNAKQLLKQHAVIGQFKQP